MLEKKFVPSTKPDFLTGGGEMEKLIRTFDWSKTPIGPLESWSMSLKHAVNMCLTSDFPNLIYCGSDFTSIYNDAFIPICGNKHPDGVLGIPGRVAHREIWKIIEPILQLVMTTGKSERKEDLLLPLYRTGFLEENYFTLAHGPIGLMEGRIEGVFVTVFNTTPHVIHARHLQTLKDLGISPNEAKTVEECCRLVAKTLEHNDADIPFALLYLLEAEHNQAILQGTTRLEPGTEVSPKILSLDESKSIWPLARVIKSNTLELVDVSHHLSLPSGRWDERPKQAVLVPIVASDHKSLIGTLIAGISPRRAFDENYRNFFNLVTSLISSAIVNTQAYEKEQQRAEALAKIDRAKTVFFSNVSHEFRTPLTLLLDPLEEAIADTKHPLQPQQVERLQMARRSALRLLKLTNTLLDFSRIEAGRMQAHYEATDLAKLTIDLSSMFRAAMEKAGLQFKVEMEFLDEPVYVDRDMWEKIIFNLLSNAFKYTLQGNITVALKKKDHHLELSVSDSGVGIPIDELPKIFERFHRVADVHGRSHEGTGIGLALIQELAKLHGGIISVTSQVGKGSTFTVSIPLGKAHLPAEQIRSQQLSTYAPGAIGSVFVEEALRWLPVKKESKEALELPIPISTTLSASPTPTLKAKILFADDNADMREYVGNLLGLHYEVTVVADGEAALQEALAQKFDLILSDIMMPKLDGFQLTQALRKNPQTKWLPIILLSARAGEEARIEGLAQGADDYLVKPFSAKELLAHIRTHVQLGRIRAELKKTVDELQQTNISLAKSEKNYRTLTAISPVGIFHIDKAGQVTYFNQKGYEMLGLTAEEALGEKWAQALHPEDKAGVLQLWDKTKQGEIERFKAEYRFLRKDGSIVWIAGEVIPEKDSSGVIQSYIGTITDITELVNSQKNYRILTAISPVGIFHIDKAGQVTYFNQKGYEMLGLTAEEALGEKWAQALHPEDKAGVLQLWDKTKQGEIERFKAEYRFLRKDGSIVWIAGEVIPEKDSSGVIQSYIGTITDITELRNLEKERHEAAEKYRQQLEQFTDTLCHELRNPLNGIYGNVSLLIPLLATLEESIRKVNVQVLSTTFRDECLTTITEFQKGVEYIKQCAKYQKVIMDDVLNLSKLEAKKVQLNEENLEPKKVIQEVVSMLAADISRKKLKLNLEFGYPDICVIGDSTRLAQVLINLLSNAIKFTPEKGEITLGLRLLEQTTDHTILQFMVKDTGMGMIKEEQDQLFQRFAQASSKIFKEHGGSGLGLVISKDLVELMGGKITVESKKGQGTQFTFTINCKNAEKEEQRITESKLVTKVGQAPADLQILIVEDNLINQQILRKQLEQAGYRCQVANHGQEALELFKATPINFIFMDLEMPVMNGLEATKAIRELEKGKEWQRPEVPIIGLSGNVRPEQMDEALGTGMNDYLAKPYERAQLLEKIAHYTQKCTTATEPVATSLQSGGQSTNYRKSI